MSTEVTINIANSQPVYSPGDRILGTAQLKLASDFPVATNVLLSFRCLGQVNWGAEASCPGEVSHQFETTAYHDRHFYLEHIVPAMESGSAGSQESERHYYLKEPLPFTQSSITEVVEGKQKNVTIPFDFEIPRNKNLPSTMTSENGFIRYFIGVSIMSVDGVELKKFTKELFVQSPMRDNLMISVGGSAEKVITSHDGKVSMHASIDRKGYAAGETISVHVAVDNGINVAVKPRVSLHQVQILMSALRHKASDKPIAGKEPIVGKEIPANGKSEQSIDIAIPEETTLSVKSSMITVKYMVRVTLDIPDSFGLQIFLPIVVTKQGVIGV